MMKLTMQFMINHKEQLQINQTSLQIYASLLWKKGLLNKCVSYYKISNLHLTMLVFSIRLYNELIWNEIYITSKIK